MTGSCNLHAKTEVAGAPWTQRILIRENDHVEAILTLLSLVSIEWPRVVIEAVNLACYSPTGGTLAAELMLLMNLSMRRGAAAVAYSLLGLA